MPVDENIEKVVDRKRKQDIADDSKANTSSLEESMLEEDLVLLGEIDIEKFETKNEAEKSSKLIKVNPRLKGAPIISFLNDGTWVYDPTIKADFQINESTVCVFLSVKFHMFNPKYIHERFKEVHHKYRVCVFLVLCDVVIVYSGGLSVTNHLIQEPTHVMKELDLMAINEKASLIVAWSLPEASHYITSLKKNQDSIMGGIKMADSTNHQDLVVDILTSIKGINSTDARILCSRFNSFKNIVNAPREELAKCNGIGPNKAEILYKMFRKNLP